MFSPAAARDDAFSLGSAVAAARHAFLRMCPDRSLPPGRDRTEPPRSRIGPQQVSWPERPKHTHVRGVSLAGVGGGGRSPSEPVSELKTPVLRLFGVFVLWAEPHFAEFSTSVQRHSVRTRE